MKILFQIPFKETLYAERTIYNAYKDAFIDLAHTFKTLTANDNCKKVFEEFDPDIFMTSLNSYYLKFLNLDIIRKYRKKGLVVFVGLPFWNSPLSMTRINETYSLSKNKKFVDLIKSDSFGDVYCNTCEPEDPRMDGFEKETGYKYYTILLGADKINLKAEFSEKFKTDISFIGTYLPQKRDYFRKYVFPLKKKYDLAIYGQDWGILDRTLGWVQRGGQYFNIPYIKSLRKLKLKLEDEAKIYNSSLISINIHEDFQVRFGGDCNERTFKIPFCGGFEITDNVACIRKYFKNGEEIVIAENEKDWYEKVDYYIKNPNKRNAIIEAGKKKVLAEHTYHNRVNQVIDIYDKIKRCKK